MSKPLLKLDDIHHSYGEGDAKLDVLTGAALALNAGELVALVAPSGAGKSTLLHIAGLLEQPVSGSVEVNGKSTIGLNDRDRTNLRRISIGFVYQFHHLLPEFSALENVVMPMIIAGVNEREAHHSARDLLNRLGVGPRASHRPAEMSGGEQQRVAIARAAANRPHIILADEPTGNLDPETSTMVFDALVELMKEQGSGTLFVTHDHNLARRADRVITLAAGKLVETSL